MSDAERWAIYEVACQNENCGNRDEIIRVTTPVGGRVVCGGIVTVLGVLDDGSFGRVETGSCGAELTPVLVKEIE